MTSAVGREDIRAELYRAGIRSSFTLSRLMTAIDLYALAQVRNAAPLPDITIAPDEFGHLLPGDWDLAERVTRCAGKCSRAKRWSYFGADKDHPTGRKTTCKSCARTRPDPSPDDRRWKCPICLKDKPPKAFGQEKQDNPRVRAACLSCSKTLPAG